MAQMGTNVFVCGVRGNFYLICLLIIYISVAWYKAWVFARIYAGLPTI